MNVSLPRRQVIVWSLFALLLVAIVVHEATDIFDTPPVPASGNIPMFTFAESQLARIEVAYKGKTAAAVRGEDGNWHRAGDGHHHAHHDDPHHHDDAHHHDDLLQERMGLAVRMRADRQVAPEQGLDGYGLENPQAMVAFYGRAGNRADLAKPLSILYVGDLLPDTYTYYAKREGDDDLSLVPRYHIALLLAALFGEDQAPTPLPVLNKGTE